MNLFKEMLEINPRHVVLGRYSDNENLYRPAFACILMEVDNKRWKEVPFVLTSGKGILKPIEIKTRKLLLHFLINHTQIVILISHSYISTIHCICKTIFYYCYI